MTDLLILPSKFIEDCKKKVCSDLDRHMLQSIADEINLRAGSTICLVREAMYDIGLHVGVNWATNGSVLSAYIKMHAILDNMDEEVLDENDVELNYQDYIHRFGA